MLLEVERHLASQGRVPGPALVLDGVLVHADLGAPLEPAGPALVPVGLVHQAGTLGLGLAHVLPVPPDGSLEEAGAPVASENPVVFPRAVVSANFAGDVV